VVASLPGVGVALLVPFGFDTDLAPQNSK